MSNILVFFIGGWLGVVVGFLTCAVFAVGRNADETEAEFKGDQL